MHPLSTFPSLLTFGLFAPLLLRLCVGSLILLFGFERYKTSYKWASIFYAVSGVLLVLGLYTQLAAILGLIILRFDMWVEKKKSPVSRQYLLFDITLSIILISLIFTGPGFFAFDLPL